MTLPSTDTIATYGGLLNNYSPVEDPTTDRDATAANKAYSSIAAATHTVPRAYVVILGHAVTPTVVEHDSVWGNSSAVVPTLARAGTGDITITWPASVTGEDTVLQALALKRGLSVNIEGTVAGVGTISPLGDPNKMQLRLFDMAGVANDFAGKNIVVTVR